ncbi:Probable NAD(P)H-dependent D-xylose reductase xyl1 [Seminavis robusta]|uniref:Probable NAD(P)H-dependent D-xylose reductase xyl1 n=1 Tax=Seminavis robusta TaxID=568900 RepID=A0A9N8EP48_9STRA|nr:Probable NAD(P)H-dependent D-xylose reductase xyl1 [Seminavis robusta]|eukprot:Sro1569_g283180.1 Probable NAD(P)H-dependent D-xylose reductase xyl1 (283) ;mRNA; r:20596-21444
MPLVGAGTWQYNDTIAYQSVCKALQAGYTMIDTAWGYKNQVGVGLAIKDCWQGRREDLFVLTKVPGGLTPGETTAMHYQNLWELQLDYVDHLMVHFPSDWEQEHTGKQQRQDEWKALEELYHSDKTRSIGISHYCAQHIDDILEIAKIKPTLNQVEYHVGAKGVDNNVMHKCAQEGILFMSFSPLCGPCQLDSPDDSLVTGKLVTEIASHYPNKTGAQVALRFIVQQALDRPMVAGVIPKSNNAQHIAQNMDIFDFELTQDDMALLTAAQKPKPEPGDCAVP